MKKETLDKLTLLQDALNEYITPNWKNVRTELDFMISSHQEMAELIDTNVMDGDTKHSLNWKWWKENVSSNKTTSSVDWDNMHKGVKDNIKIELTDLLFFTLSQKALGDLTGEDEEVLLSENDWINFMSISANNLLQRPGSALMLILELANKIDFNISAYYIAKHTLNTIRQLSGYKDGSYVKVNNGVEDNELLHDVIKSVTINDLETNFNEVADTIMKGVYDIFDVDEKDRMNVTKWAELIVDTIPVEE